MLGFRRTLRLCDAAQWLQPQLAQRPVGARLRRRPHRPFSSTAPLLWKAVESAPPQAASALDNKGASLATTTVKPDASALRATELGGSSSRDSRRVMEQKDAQTLIADSISPYDQIDPVLVSALLCDDLDRFLAKHGVSREEFIEDFDRARGQDGTKRDRYRFKRKYGFNCLAVAYREDVHATPQTVLDSLQIHIMSFQPEKSTTEGHYRWWEAQLRDMFTIGYHLNEYAELKRWYEKDVAHRVATLQYAHNVGHLVYRVCCHTGRVDVKAAERLYSPRYLASWDEVNRAFRLDLPDPDSWAPLEMTDAIKLARQVDDCNRDDEGVYHNMSFPVFFSHFHDFHTSFHPFKHHCRVTGTFMFPTQEMIKTLSEYLVERAKAYEASDVPILEVGAGTGRLAWLLNQSEAFQKADLKCVATDIKPQQNPFMLAYPRSLRDRFKSFEIEQIDQAAAVEKYRPAIVLCQMLPNAVDWPQTWRRSRYVCEYVMIGPADGPLCGRPWDTWGVHWGESAEVRVTPKFLREGWKKVYVDSISRYLINQDDHPQCSGTSRVVSFRKMGSAEFFVRFWLWHVGQVFIFFGALFVFAWNVNPLQDRSQTRPDQPLPRV